MADIRIELVLIGVGIVANGFFAGSEIALLSARTSRLAQMCEQRIAGAAIHSETSPFVSEEEVRYLVREGTAQGI